MFIYIQIRIIIARHYDTNKQHKFSIYLFIFSFLFFMWDDASVNVVSTMFFCYTFKYKVKQHGLTCKNKRRRKKMAYLVRTLFKNISTIKCWEIAQKFHTFSLPKATKLVLITITKARIRKHWHVKFSSSSTFFRALIYTNWLFPQLILRRGDAIELR